MSTAKSSAPAWTVGGLVTGIAAAGDAQGTATELNGAWNVVATATGTSADGLRLPDDYPLNVPMIVINTTAVALDVFPPTGGAINGGTADAAKALAANMSGLYVQYSAGNWGAVLSA